MGLRRGMVDYRLDSLASNGLQCKQIKLHLEQLHQCLGLDHVMPYPICIVDVCYVC